MGRVNVREDARRNLLLLLAGALLGAAVVLLVALVVIPPCAQCPVGIWSRAALFLFGAVLVSLGGASLGTSFSDVNL